MKVRAATEDDALEAVEVLRASITQLCAADHQHDPDTLARWLANKNIEQFCAWCADSQCYVVVAEQDDVLVGVGMFQETGDFNLCYIKPNWQRRGIGSAIVRAIERHAHREGHREIHLLSSKDAQQFWAHHGYTPSGDATPAYGVVWDIPFSKRLSALAEA